MNAAKTDPFLQLVESDTHTDEKQASLREPTNVRRWYDTLVEMKVSSEAQLAEINSSLLEQKDAHIRRGPKAKEDWFKLEANLKQRRSSLIRKKSRIEARLSEAKSALRAMTQGSADTVITNLKARLEAAEAVCRAVASIFVSNDSANSDETACSPKNAEHPADHVVIQKAQLLVVRTLLDHWSERASAGMSDRADGPRG